MKSIMLNMNLNNSFDNSQPISYNGIEITETMSQEITLELLKQLDWLKIKKYSDALFFGQVHPKSGQREGKGIMKYKNGRVYEGEFYHDLRHGNGFELYPNGNTYIGGFYEGKAHGSGIYKWNNGEVYDGEWKHGLKNGNGMWKGVNGDSYIGEWIESRADGYGVHVWSNGDRYEGEWQGWLKHGHGTDLFANGDVYVGEYSNGKPDGSGQYTWSNGSFYVGEFKSGLKHGKGKWRRSKDNNTNQYEGEYKNDKKNGFGEFTWASGNTYKGSYKDDEREGFGIMRWTDGSNYEGDWVRGIQHGKGKMSFPDGSLKQGYFENNIFKGDNPIVAKGKNSPRNKNFKKSSSNLSEGRSSHLEKGLASGRKNGKNSSNTFNNTGKIKKHLFIRQHSSTSKDRVTKNQLNNSNPNTGYINENGSHSTLPAAVIRKPGGAKKSTSDKNSSFGDNSPTSPYLNPEKEYMLSWIANGGNIEADAANNQISKTSFGINEGANYNTHQASSKKLPTNSKLEPLFSQSNGGGDRNKHLANNNSSNSFISPKARSHYGKFPGKTKKKIEIIKNSRGGSGDRSRDSKAKARLSPLQNKPRKKVPKK